MSTLSWDAAQAAIVWSFFFCFCADIAYAFVQTSESTVRHDLFYPRRCDTPVRIVDDVTYEYGRNLQSKESHETEYPTASPFTVSPSSSTTSTPKRSVSDYMGGHHAGKFDFDTRIGGVTALNYEKSIVFDESMNDGYNGAILANANFNDNLVSDLPSWATRSINMDHAKTLQVRECIASATVSNDERTWEAFYACVQSKEGLILEPSDCGIQINPRSGVLAPRGGANNACDECRPYSDKWDFQIRISEAACNDDLCYLVVRTECDYWVWRLQP